jgi:hypothetical protein
MSLVTDQTNIAETIEKVIVGTLIGDSLLCALKMR